MSVGNRWHTQFTVILGGSNKKVWAGIEEAQVMQEPRMSTRRAVTMAGLGDKEKMKFPGFSGQCSTKQASLRKAVVIC